MKALKMEDSKAMTEDQFTGETISQERIMDMIPHRHPILLIQEVRDVKLGESCVGINQLTEESPCFEGHFPSRAVMPGVLIVEAIAQTAAVLVVRTLGEKAEGSLVYFMSIESAKFRKPVVPGDMLELRVKQQKNKRNVYKFDGEAYVGDTKVAEATISAMILDEK